MKKLSKETKRVQLSFTLRESVKKRLLDHCKENLLNKSMVLESIIIEFFENKDFGNMKRHE